MADMELVEFIRARLDEDEQVARTGARLHDDEPADPSYAGGIADLESAGWEPVASQRFNAFVAHFDPARALREVDAKRRMIDREVEQARENWRRRADEHRLTFEDWISRWPPETLRMLAAPYDDHVDYRAEWRPE